MKLYPERATATTCLHRIRVIEYESATIQSVGEIEMCTREIKERLRVDENFDSVHIQRLIPFARGAIESERIRQPRASSTLHTNAKAVRVGDLVLSHDLRNLLACFVRE